MFTMIGMRYQCKIVEVGHRLVQRRIDRQYGRLRHHSLGIFTEGIFIYFTQVAEGIKDRARIYYDNTRVIRSKTMETNL